MTDPIADTRSRRPRRIVFADGLEVDARIGCYPHEFDAPQPVRISFRIEVQVPADPLSDRLEDALCYHRFSDAVRDLAAGEHIRLVETLAERIAALAIDHPLALCAWVRVEKPEAVPEARAIGVEVTRFRSPDQP